MSIEKMNYMYPNESFSGCDMVATINFIDNEKRVQSKVLGSLQTISYSIHMEKKPVRSIGNVNAKDYVIGPRTIAGSLVFAVFNRHFAQDIIKDINYSYKEGHAFLVDELPPFDIVISLANEYGIKSRIAIYGIRLLTEGQVMSVNDVFTENTYQFFATDLEYLNDDLTYSKSSTENNILLKNKDEINNDSRDLINSIIDLNSNDKNVILSIDVKQPNAINNKGVAYLSLNPKQTNGFISIYNNDNVEVSKIPVNSNDLIYSIELNPDKYYAAYSNDTINSNNVTFFINKYLVDYSYKLYEPTIEYVLDTKIGIYSNEYHKKVKVSSSDKTMYYELKNRRCVISNLLKNTSYTISTCDENGNNNSPEVIVRTLKESDTMFNKLKELVNYNRNLLIYNNIYSYYNIIDKAKELCSSFKEYKNIAESIALIKQQLDNDKKYFNNIPSKLEEINEKITICLELIFISSKINNDTSYAINMSTIYNIPYVKLDNNYNNIIVFPQNTISADIYRLSGSYSLLVTSISKNELRTIDNIPNSYRYIGKAGEKYYVQATVDKMKSPKIDFYIMNENDKQIYKNNFDYKTLDNKNINIYNNEYSSEILMLRELKKINKNTLEAPIIKDVNSNFIIIDCDFSNMFNDVDCSYYLSISEKDNLLNKIPIYKKLINSNEIIINAYDYGLKIGQDYFIWYEDEKFNQISNITNFNLNDNIYKNKLLNDLEIEERLLIIKSALTISSLNNNDISIIINELKNNEELNMKNILSKTIESILNIVDFSEIKSIIYNLKNLFKINSSKRNDRFFNNVSMDSRIINIQSAKEGSLCIFTIDKNRKVKNYSINLYNNTNMDLTNTDCNILIAYAITKDLSECSDVLFIDMFNSKVEVI